MNDVKLPVTLEMVSSHTPRTTRALRQRLTRFANLRLVDKVSPITAVARMDIRSDVTRERYENWLARFCAETGLTYEPWRDAFSRAHGRYTNSRGVDQ